MCLHIFANDWRSEAISYSQHQKEKVASVAFSFWYIDWVEPTKIVYEVNLRRFGEAQRRQKCAKHFSGKQAEEALADILLSNTYIFTELGNI